MQPTAPPGPDARRDELAALRMDVEGTAAEIGERFFQALVENLARVLGTYGAWVTEYLPGPRSLRAMAFWLGGQWVEGFEQAIDGTPCQVVIDGRRLVHYPDQVLDLYPNLPGLRKTGAVSYMGVALSDVDGAVLGHLAVLDRRPMPADPQALALFEIFAGRAAAELRRLRAERDVREREEKLARLVGSAMDAILELDDGLRVTQMNRAAERTFDLPAAAAVGSDFQALLGPGEGGKLTALV